MKIYKKYNTRKNDFLNETAKNYIKKNKMKCKFFAFVGMGTLCDEKVDYILIDGKIYTFSQDSFKILK